MEWILSFIVWNFISVSFGRMGNAHPKPAIDVDPSILNVRVGAG